MILNSPEENYVGKKFAKRWSAKTKYRIQMNEYARRVNEYAGILFLCEWICWYIILVWMNMLVYYSCLNEYGSILFSCKWICYYNASILFLYKWIW